MSLQLFRPHKTVWTVSTWVWLCTSVNTYMKSHFTVCLKHLPTIRTLIRSSVAVCTTHMWLQVAWLAKTFVTQWTFVRFLSTVNSVVGNKDTWYRESFATNSTFKWFLSWMTSPVYCQCITAPTTFTTFLYLLVWMFLCWDRLFRDEKLFSHWLQEYRCSPVCLLLWMVKYCFVVNPLSQTVQRYCFSPSLVLLWSFKLLLVRTSSDEFPVRVKITDKH